MANRIIARMGADTVAAIVSRSALASGSLFNLPADATRINYGKHLRAQGRRGLMLECRLAMTQHSEAATTTPFSVLIATVAPGLARAERTGGGWETRPALEHVDVRCLAAANAGTVLAGTQGDGLWRSEDAGASWQRSGLDGQIVKSLSFCALEPAVVYAGTKPPCVYRSDDSGRTWHELESFRDIRGRSLWRQPAERPSTAYVQALACSPTDPGVVIAGMEAGAVVRTNDGGRSWSNHLGGSCRDCHTLVFHPDGEHVYEGGGGVMAPGVAISRDRGRSWERPAEGLDRKYGWAVAADPGDPERVFVALSPASMKAHSRGDAHAVIFKRQSQGAWHALRGGLPEPLDHMPYALLTHPSASAYLLAGLGNGDLWETGDGGETWRRCDVRLPAVHRTLTGL